MDAHPASSQAIRPAARQQLGCPVDGCTWRSDPFPALTPGSQLPAHAASAWVLHVWWAHPRWRTVINTSQPEPDGVG